MHSIYHLVLPALLLAAPLLAQLPAQLRLSALSEAQFGNLPEGEPSGLKTSYHQLSLDYALEGFQIGLRGEGFGSSEPDRNYGELLQRFASYRRGPLQATIGHFYTIVGSGILAHAFELPGVITEERGSRRRYQIVRDLDGAHVRYRAGRATVQLLRGTPINTNLPPASTASIAAKAPSRAARYNSKRIKTSTPASACCTTILEDKKKLVRPSTPAGASRHYWPTSDSKDSTPTCTASTRSAT